MLKKLILVIGSPGSGKSTVCTELTSKHENDIESHSVAKVVKEKISDGSAIGKIMNTYVDQGDLIPGDLIMHEVLDLIKHASKSIVLIDGFPRGLNQMKTLGDAIYYDDDIQLISVIEVKVSRVTARKRRLLDDVSEDDKKVFEHKLDVYDALIKDIEAYYAKDDLLTIIDGEQECDDVYKSIDAYLTEQISIFK
jgi:adenylate kinase